MIPGVNDSEAAVQAIAEFVAGAGGAWTHELLAYHRFGEGKYAQLGQRYALRDVESPSEHHMRALRAVAAHPLGDPLSPAL